MRQRNETWVGLSRSPNGGPGRDSGMAAADGHWGSGRTVGTRLDKQSKDALGICPKNCHCLSDTVALKICFRLPGCKLCRRGQHRQEGRRRIGRLKDRWGRRWRSSGGSPPPPPPRSLPLASHPPLPEARRFSPGNLGALLPPDSGSTGSKVPDTGHSRNSPRELLPMGLCTVRNHGLRIILT